MGKNYFSIAKSVHVVLRLPVHVFTKMCVRAAYEWKREKCDDGSASLVPKRIEFVDGDGIYARNSYVAAAAAPPSNTRTIELEKRGGLLCSRIPSHIVEHTYTTTATAATATAFTLCILNICARDQIGVCITYECECIVRIYLGGSSTQAVMCLAWKGWIAFGFAFTDKKKREKEYIIDEIGTYTYFRLNVLQIRFWKIYSMWVKLSVVP